MRRLVAIVVLIFWGVGCPQILLVADEGTGPESHDGGADGGSGDRRDAGADAGDGGSSLDGGTDAGTRIGPFVWFDLTPSMMRPEAMAVDGRGKNDVYVGYQNALIDRWDGQNWTVLNAQTGPTLASLVAVADGGLFAGGAQRIMRCLDDGTCSDTWLGVMVRRLCRGPSDIYLATAESTTQSSLWRFMGSQWNQVGSTQASAGFRGCAVTPDGTAAYVAGQRYVFRAPFTASMPVGEWSSDIGRAWHAVWATDAAVYAVGEGKHVGTRPIDGTPDQWKDVFDGDGGGPLVAVEAAPKGLPVFAAGELGTSPGQIAVYDGNGWTLHALPEPVNVNDLYVVSETELYVVGKRIGVNAARVYFGVFAP